MINGLFIKDQKLFTLVLRSGVR